MAEHNQRVRMEWGPSSNVAGGTSDVWYSRVPGPPGAKYRIESAYLMNNNAISANGTNFATMALANFTTSTAIGSRAFSSVDLAAGASEELTVAEAGTEVTAGDILSWTKSETAAGMAIHVTVVVELVRFK